MQVIDLFSSPPPPSRRLTTPSAVRGRSRTSCAPRHLSILYIVRPGKPIKTKRYVQLTLPIRSLCSSFVPARSTRTVVLAIARQTSMVHYDSLSVSNRGQSDHNLGKQDSDCKADQLERDEWGNTLI